MLFLGSLLKVVVKCSASHVTQKAIVAAFMKSLDDAFDEKDDEACSRLAGGDKNPSDYVMDALGNLNETDYDDIVAYFGRNVVPLIKENERETVVDAISLIILADDSINDNTVVNPITQLTKNDLSLTKRDISSFLAGVFIYTLRNTKNKHNKGEAKAIAEEFVTQAKTAKKQVVRKNNTQRSQPVVDDRTTLRFFRGNHFTSSSIAIILSTWDENNQYDIKIIETLTGKEYSDVYEDLRIQNEIAFIIKDGIVKCNTFDVLRDSIISDIDEHFLLLLFDSFNNVLKTSTEYSGLSNECTFGICDFLARFGCHIKIAKRITSSKWKSCFYSFMDSIINNRKALYSIPIGLELLVEADMDGFLVAVENAVQKEEGVLNTILKEEKNSSIIYHLAYALKKAAGSERSFSNSMRILFALSEYNEVFFENMGYVLFMRCPQTTASLENRIGVIKNFFMKNPILAWRYLISILPGYRGGSFIPSSFRYYPISFTVISTVSIEQAFDEYINLACLKMAGTIEEAVDLIRIFPMLPSKSAGYVADSLIKKVPLEKKSRRLIPLLENAYSYIDNYDVHKAESINVLYKHFMSYNNSVHLRKLFKLTSKSSEESIEEAKQCINSILNNEGLMGLVEDITEVEDVYSYFEIVSSVLSDEEMKQLFDSLWKKDQMWHLKLAVNSMTTDRIINVLRSCPEEIRILCKHLCDPSLMKYINALPGEKANEFWSNVEYIDENKFNKKDFGKIIKLLLANKNYCLAVRILSFRIHRTEVDNNLIIRVLDDCVILDDVSSSMYVEMSYPIESLISYLQKQQSIPSVIMETIERKYINLLISHSEFKAPNVFCRMANDPEYVEKILIERIRHIENGVYNSVENTLFRFFRVTPGTQKDSSFDYESFYRWYDFAEKESNPVVKKDMLELFGRASYHVGGDEDGFFINRKVAEFFEMREGYELITMFEIEINDSIGPITISEDLSEPKAIISELIHKAEMCECEGYLRVADAFRSVACSLETHFEL